MTNVLLGIAALFLVGQVAVANDMTQPTTGAAAPEATTAEGAVKKETKTMKKKGKKAEDKANATKKQVEEKVAE